MEGTLSLARARATFIFRAALVQTGQRTPALRERNPALALAAPAGVGQGQGVFLDKTQPNHFKSEVPAS